MAGSNEDRGGSKRLGEEERGRSSTGRVLGGQTIKGSGDAGCGLNHAQGDVEPGFLGSTPKPRSTVSPSLTSKPRSTVSPSLASKTVLVVWPQNHSLGFPDLGLKTDSCGLVIRPIK
jgi:hypothetical protein